MVPGTTTEKELARFGVGDFFGENALIENKPRDATVTAGTHCMARSSERTTSAPQHADACAYTGAADACAYMVRLRIGATVGCAYNAVACCTLHGLCCMVLCCSGGLVMPVH